MKIYIIAIFFLFGLCIQMQSQEMTLSKKQMYEDFDELIHILQDCNAQLPIRKIVTGIDQIALAKSLRSAIDTISTTDSFIALLNTVLNYMYDIHARESNAYFVGYDNLKGIDTAIMSYRENNKDFSNKHLFPANPLFANGEYFIPGIYQMIDLENRDTIFLYYSKIISYKGIPYEKYVQDNLAYFSPIGTRWDNEKKEYYSITSLIPFTDTIKVENQGNEIDIDLGRKYKISITQTDTVCKKEDVQKSKFPLGEKKVLYFEEDSILYIYLNDMIDFENLIPLKIKNIGKLKPISKIIIDVRGNRGGGDLVWHNILRAIVADTLIYDPVIAFKNTKRLKKFYSYPNAFADIRKLDIKVFDWCPDESFLVTNFEHTFLIPDSNSLQYTGKIYIIQNEEVYYAGHSLTTYASHIEQLVSIGEPSGLFAGFGLSPNLFQLKHSKFSFRIELAIDVSEVKEPSDVYQNIPEIIVAIPPKEKFEYIKDHSYDKQSKEYLYKYDYLFRKIAEMK
ncbi:MAG: hypothetical protein LBV02_06800 [Bacteroidales bacterium]|jgi:hypothetical protein|nr:hypothetical protein [Bacteroidales bacterium]